jgi:hypothetical protein
LCESSLHATTELSGKSCIPHLGDTRSILLPGRLTAIALPAPGSSPNTASPFASYSHHRMGTAFIGLYDSIQEQGRPL